MKLSPIGIKYLQEVLHTDAINTVEEYAVWGGVPRYWELRLQEDNLQEAISEHILSPLGTLYEEPIRLFMDDVFMDFYFHFVVPNRFLIELGRNRLVADTIRPQFSRFVSAWWEKLCRQTAA